jgi:hypothetical protein
MTDLNKTVAESHFINLLRDNLTAAAFKYRWDFDKLSMLVAVASGVVMTPAVQAELAKLLSEKFAG